ncbi:peptidase M22, glycoprotease [Gottschalkia acidurici 9a]|uniref:Peptidase M22, glycoprotease n=1 Tax=Gottschalkia acidurici (strain ATCC 7906 / DSM 604 / BCRC 14475 / CIP 104303 / KCTC 5404 / NCIMB 10678 / 9a) TaxID=1128398 RepID=K0AU35_GOTA9|nr:tRNA (adenosine(37)-N6)-threonylcarbamoyltransferase complex dimerization subunit type 1 TsaB [Gottschalkia acidurici]AFS77348.1 peptidase M22, glycoprotease [Gottschalkia acidurici 9a]
MKVLAIDTSSTVASCAIMDDEKLLGEVILNDKTTHSQKLLPMIKQVLENCKLKPEDIDIYGAAIGPGSFTGLRIGVATIKSLAHAVEKRVVGVSSLEALALNIPFSQSLIVPIMDARRDRVFTAIYKWETEELKTIMEPDVIELSELITILKEKENLLYLMEMEL